MRVLCIVLLIAILIVRFGVMHRDRVRVRVNDSVRFSIRAKFRFMHKVGIRGRAGVKIRKVSGAGIRVIYRIRISDRFRSMMITILTVLLSFTADPSARSAGYGIVFLSPSVIIILCSCYCFLFSFVLPCSCLFLMLWMMVMVMVKILMSHQGVHPCTNGGENGVRVEAWGSFDGALGEEEEEEGEGSMVIEEKGESVQAMAEQRE